MTLPLPLAILLARAIGRSGSLDAGPVYLDVGGVTWCAALRGGIVHADCAARVLPVAERAALADGMRPVPPGGISPAGAAALRIPMAGILGAVWSHRWADGAVA